jgi:ABC-type transport system involved in multi-copper enzyme maturation permease subunit
MTTHAVFRREWIGRRNTFLLALGLGFIYLTMIRFDHQMGAYRDKATIILATTSILLPWAVAALFGATMVGRELEERRFGFLLNQPIRLGEIFLGKVAAGLGIALAFGFLACLPALLLGGIWRQVSLLDAARLLGLGMAGCIVLLLFFHAASIQVRSHSLWLVLDLVAWTAFGWGVRALTWKLLLAGVFEEMFHLWLLLLVVVTAGLGIAGYLQVAEGRADLKRGHRWVSTTLALSLGIALLLGWAQTALALKHLPAKSGTHAGSTRIR